MRRWLLLILIAVGCSSSTETAPLGGSSSSGGAKLCTPGLQVKCDCPGGALSVQVCLADGSGYGACECGSSTSSGGMGGMSASSSSSTSSSGMGGATMIACSKQTDCNALTTGCSVGSCVNGTCEAAHAPDNTTCDDGLFCTEGDHCVAGACTGGSAKACPDGSDPCHVGFCDGQKQACAIAAGNDGKACDDKNVCTGDGVCNGGSCVPGVAISCAQFDTQCTKGVCDPQSGCGPAPVNEGLGCDDGLFCTDGDVCLAGTCGGKAKACPPPVNGCGLPVCDEVANACTIKPGMNGSACSDGLACTQNDVCGNGICKGTPVVACVNGDGCCPAGCTSNVDSDCAFTNGLGGFYSTSSMDRMVNAKLACESVWGLGQCATDGCGSCNNRGYHKAGTPNCNGSTYWNFLDLSETLSCGWVNPNEILISADNQNWTQ